VKHAAKFRGNRPGAYVAFGPYHDDRTWNLVRNSAKIETIPIPSQEPGWKPMETLFKQVLTWGNHGKIKETMGITSKIIKLSGKTWI
jgi:hypothetical protein